ncbi:4Fe-4S binding protein [Candidatus Bipolaricaulota bacterium]|nr:4Fe-4S binding protein [Candidatus Bipolaricaulota bacterium]
MSDRQESLWRTTGHLDPESVEVPSKERLKEGAIAVIECPQKIPCDPCSQNCPIGAINMSGINGIPEVDYEKCTGCSICAQYCPGLAIFLLDCTPDQGCNLTLPYEFSLPEIGEEVDGLNRKGEVVATGVVQNTITQEESAGDTSTVTVRIPEANVNGVRNIRRQNDQR